MLDKDDQMITSEKVSIQFINRNLQEELYISDMLFDEEIDKTLYITIFVCFILCLLAFLI